MIYKAAQLIDSRSEHGESSWWDDRRGIVLFMDCWNPVMWTHDPATGESRKIDLEFTPMAIVGTEDGGYVGASADTIYKLTSDFRIKNTIRKMNFEGTKSRFNDCKCGPDGAFYLGTTGEPGDNNFFFRLDPDGSIEAILEHVGVSNGFAWSKDQKTLYYTDTIHNEIYAFDYADGKLSGKRTVYHSETDIPDGFCIDEEDNLWVAMWGKGSVDHIDTKAGCIIDSVEAPSKFTSSCMFGSEGMDMLYITSSRLDLFGEDKEKDQISGNVFAVKTGVKGQKQFYGKF